MIEINIIIVVRPVGVEAVDTTATLILALLPRRNLATRVMMFIAICARDSKARKLARGIAQERDVSLHRLAVPVPVQFTLNQ